jgi:hypothetical protein
MYFDFHAEFFERQAHGRAKILERVDRRHREIAAFHARTMGFVAILVALA